MWKRSYYGTDHNNDMLDKKRLSEAKKWYFRLMNDPEQFEKEKFIDRINEYNSIIKDY